MRVLPAEDGGGTATSRPAPPDHGPGRWFRVCAGVKEDVMDWVPSERAKYAGLGIIVLNTGCLAAFAMFSALGKIVTASPVALAPIALVWGWMIFSIDRWLITSSHGMRGVNRVLVFIPRLLLATLIAFTIAEPLVLRIFQNSLDTQVKTTRTQQLDYYESQLQKCNPVSGQWVTSPGCNGYHVKVTDSPLAAQQKLAAAQKAVAQLQPEVNSAWNTYQAAVNRQADECAGIHAPGTSGIPGFGRLCDADRATTASDKTIYDNLAAQLTAARNTLNKLSPQAGDALQAYDAQLNMAITNKVAVEKADLGQIGIIDEWKALQQLSDSSSFVFYGHWLLVLVLIALDCLPVLAKLMGGTSAYDQMLADQVDTDKGVHAIDLRLRKDTATVDKEVEIYLIEMRRRERMRNEDRAERVRNAEGETDGLDDVRVLAAKWLKEGVAAS
jgi:hypothetical protein